MRGMPQGMKGRSYSAPKRKQRKAPPASLKVTGLLGAKDSLPSYPCGTRHAVRAETAPFRSLNGGTDAVVQPDGPSGSTQTRAATPAGRAFPPDTNASFVCSAQYGELPPIFISPQKRAA